jgi:hypothetical protein
MRRVAGIVTQRTAQDPDDPVELARRDEAESPDGAEQASASDRDLRRPQQLHQDGIHLRLEQDSRVALEDDTRARVDEYVVQPAFGRIPAIHAHGPTS